MTRVVQIFGAPGSGKSTLAALLFSLAKRAGLSVELVTEFAKDLTWAERFSELRDQLWVSAQQRHRIEVLRGRVDWVITDSPVLQGALYSGDDSRMYRFLLDYCKPAPEDLVIYVPVGRVPFENRGRTQSRADSIRLDEDLKRLLAEADCFDCAFHYDPTAHNTAPWGSVFDTLLDVMRGGRA